MFLFCFLLSFLCVVCGGVQLSLCARFTWKIATLVERILAADEIPTAAQHALTFRRRTKKMNAVTAGKKHTCGLQTEASLFYKIASFQKPNGWRARWTDGCGFANTFHQVAFSAWKPAIQPARCEEGWCSSALPHSLPLHSLCNSTIVYRRCMQWERAHCLLFSSPSNIPVRV